LYKSKTKMNTVITTFLLVTAYLLLVRCIFYIVDRFKSISKPKFLYFKDFTFELLVSLVVASIIGLIFLMYRSMELMFNIINR